jgi:hypothetical protein
MVEGESPDKEKSQDDGGNFAEAVEEEKKRTQKLQ